MSREARYQTKLTWHNSVCPIPECHREPTDAHHTLFRRKPDHPWLYTPENITMVCHQHHVPEAPRLGFYCIRYKFVVQGMTPEAIEAYAKRMEEIFTSPIALAEFYYEARADVFGY